MFVLMDLAKPIGLSVVSGFVDFDQILGERLILALLVIKLCLLAVGFVAPLE